MSRLQQAKKYTFAVARNGVARTQVILYIMHVGKGEGL